MADDLDRLLQLAIGHHQSGRHAEAEAGYRAVLPRHPDHAGALAELGRLDFELGHVQVAADLIDSSDFFPTFAELAGAALPAGKVIDGRSFATQLRGRPAAGRDWVFIQLAKMWYVADRNWKLNQAGELFDLSDAPFSEKPVPPAGASPASRAMMSSISFLTLRRSSSGETPAGASSSLRSSSARRHVARRSTLS